MTHTPFNWDFSTTGGSSPDLTFHPFGYNGTRMNDTPECFVSHMGIYAMQPESLHERVEQIRVFAATERSVDASRQVMPQLRTIMESQGGLSNMKTETVAIVPIEGAITKKRSKFAETSALDTRKALRDLANDPSVDRIILKIDSPGGSVAGIDDLAAEVRESAKIKPVVAYIEDLGASAAYWIASQATEVVSNPSAFIGSLGVYSVVEDSSEAFERKGVKVHVISSGGVKGAGVPGTEITDEQLSAKQKIVDSINSLFMANVSGGRAIDEESLAAIFTGEVFPAKQALGLGLIDRIGTLESTFTEYQGEDMPEDDKEKKEDRPEEEESAAEDEGEEEEEEKPPFKKSKKRIEKTREVVEEEEEDGPGDDEDDEEEEEEAMDKAELESDIKAYAKELKDSGCVFGLESIESKLKRAASTAKTNDEAIEMIEAKSAVLGKKKAVVGSFAAPEDPAEASGDIVGDPAKEYNKKFKELRAETGDPTKAWARMKDEYPGLCEAVIKSRNPSL